MRATNPREAKRETYEAIVEGAYELSDLINPSDVRDDAESWDDLSDEELNREVRESIDVILSENQHQEMNDLAFELWREQLQRAPMHHLVFETDEEAVEHGYWPHSMDKWEVLDILYEKGIESVPIIPRQEARSVAGTALRDKMHPRLDVDPSNV